MNKVSAASSARRGSAVGRSSASVESKGERTRRIIVSRALSIVSDLGYEGLSIGVLAEDTKLSKSGLFAHFKSKEALQLGVFDEMVNRFTQQVVNPALLAARGEPRVRVLFDKKLEWIRGQQDLRGCLLLKASLEYHNRFGHPMRERAVGALRDWLEFLTRSVQAAIDEGHFRADLDVQQFAYEFDGFSMMYQQRHGLMRDATAGERTQHAFELLLARSRPTQRGKQISGS